MCMKIVRVVSIITVMLFKMSLCHSQSTLTMEMVVNELALESPAAILQKMQYNNKILTYINSLVSGEKITIRDFFSGH